MTIKEVHDEFIRTFPDHEDSFYVVSVLFELWPNTPSEQEMTRSEIARKDFYIKLKEIQRNEAI